MAITFEMRAENSILFVTAKGIDDSIEEVKAFGAAIIRSAIEHQCTKILSDERELEYRLGALDNFESAQFIAEFAPKVGKVAIVCDQKYLEDGEFWQNVASNRGLMAGAFTDYDKAMAWLAE
jgi:hypothetical protein